MSNFVNLRSEIGRLNTVMLHRPGIEVQQLIPDYLEKMLSEDTPHVPTAQCEHDEFAEVLRIHGVEVLYLEDLFVKVMEVESLKRQFIEDYLVVGEVQAESLKEVIREYLVSKTAKALFFEVSKGVMRRDLEAWTPKPLPLLVKDEYPFFTDPVSSMYFTRDISICIGNGMIVSSMSMPFRRRETLLMKYIHDYHPLFKEVPLWYNNSLGYSIEGGDCLVLSDKVMAIGYSQRTSLGAIEHVAGRLLRNGYERIIVFNLPKTRKYMHLDVICTMIDYDKFLTAPQVYEGAFDVYELTLKKDGTLYANCMNESLEEVFKRALGLSAVEFIKVGGGDPLTAAREHWNMGSNSLTIAPGEVITYDRNDITNDMLVKRGIKVHTIPGSELSKGRGGPRCMSMPINREDIG
ncbi:MAG: arginine deiminase [Candidatus Gastranaerophilaceae bacterium]|jgi:arginine deiminase|nr:arginine deiminase [Christensenellales bacterium]